MRLRKDVNLSEFFSQAQLCTDQIWFVSHAGDKLNLSSCLSQCLFAAAILEKSIFLEGEIICDSPSDLEILQNYLE